LVYRITREEWETPNKPLQPTSGVAGAGQVETIGSAARG